MCATLDTTRSVPGQPGVQPLRALRVHVRAQYDACRGRVPQSLVPGRLAAGLRSSLSASTVENRSSWACTGISDRSDSARTRLRTSRPCGPSRPFNDTGSPTTMATTAYSCARPAIAARSTSSPARRMAASGLTIKPVGSLTATPMRLAPTSNPSSLRTGPPSRRARPPRPRGWPPEAYRGSGLRPGPGPLARRRRRPSPWPPLAPGRRHQSRAPQRLA